MRLVVDNRLSGQRAIEGTGTNGVLSPGGARLVTGFAGEGARANVLRQCFGLAKVFFGCWLRLLVDADSLSL